MEVHKNSKVDTSKTTQSEHDRNPYNPNWLFF